MLEMLLKHKHTPVNTHTDVKVQRLEREVFLEGIFPSYFTWKFHKLVAAKSLIISWSTEAWLTTQIQVLPLKIAIQRGLQEKETVS